MPRVFFGDGFLASAKRLDHRAKIRLDKQLQLLQADTFHPKLHTKPLHGKLAGLYSFRVGRSYRAIFKVMDDAVVLLRVGNRKEVYE